MATPITPPNSEPTNPRKRLGVIGLVLVIIAGLATGAGLFMVNRGDTTQNVNAVYSSSPVAPPVFEERGARGDDPFFPLEEQVARYRVRVEDETGVALSSAEVQALDDAVKTGLFGGTEENTCDPEQLISFLYANPELGEVWATVQGIEFNEIADYVRGLDVRILAEPANVLNHGFDPTTGGAYEIDTILDAGTAVLVDANGDVRARCYCGNPIKPKPPQHRPPRCVVVGAAVLTEPAGNTRTDEAPTHVVLTGQQASTANAGVWVEIAWGADQSQTGWTQSFNLRNFYCPPLQDSGLCPGPGVVDVYGGPDTSNKVGELNGNLTTASGPLDIRGPISRVGGPTGSVVENGFVLIRFTQASPSLQNSAWVQVSQLNATDCTPIAQCVNTEFAAKSRAGGLDVRAAGVYRVEFTGHFTADRSSAEVRFLDGGQTGWITNFYTPLPWTDCDQVPDGDYPRDPLDPVIPTDPVIDPVVKCVRKTTGGVNVNTTATSTYADGLLVGNASATPVTLVGDLTPTNGRVEIQMGPGGPIGWIDVDDLDGNFKYCQPTELCAELLAPAWSIYKDGGVQVGTPGSKVQMNVWSTYALDAETNPIEVHFLVDIDGQTGWLDIEDIVAPEDPTCGETPVKPVCTSPQGATFEQVAAEKAGLAGGIESELVEAAIGEQAVRALPTSNNSAACCLTKAVFDSDAADNEQAVPVPVVVALTGATNAAGTWFEIATEYPGKWAPAVNFANPSVCQDGNIDNPCDVPTGILRGVEAPPEGACCVQSKVLGADGTSQDINPAQYAEYVDTVSDKGDFIYEMRLLPENVTIFVAPNSLGPIGACGVPITPLECPVIAVSSEVETGALRSVTCCARLSPGGDPIIVTLNDFADTGTSNDPTEFEYYTENNGTIHFDLFTAGADCAEATPPVAPDAPVQTEPAPPEPSAPAETVGDENQSEPESDPCGGADRDNDSVCDNVDNCPGTNNPSQRDSGGDQRGDACEPSDDGACVGTAGDRGDRDGDGVCNADDNCPSNPNPDQENSDSDPVGDACQNPDPCDGNDIDKDGVCDKDDNCPRISNPGQENTGPSGQGDACRNLCPADQVNGDSCCKDGTRAGGDGKCYNTCPNSDQLDIERNGCVQKCSDGSTAPSGTSCPPECPRERISDDVCCAEGYVPGGRGECFRPCPKTDGLDYNENLCELSCSNGTTVPDGGSCPPECPADRSNPSTGECCKEGTEHYHGGCYVMCGQDQPDLGDGCGPCRARGGDYDEDKICDRDDNCDVSNNDQRDKDGDGLGDACDKDS